MINSEINSNLDSFTNKTSTLTETTPFVKKSPHHRLVDKEPTSLILLDTSLKNANSQTIKRRYVVSVLINSRQIYNSNIRFKNY